MAQRSKRRVKNRSKAHQKHVKAYRKSRARARSKPGSGTKTRRARKAARAKIRKHA